MLDFDIDDSNVQFVKQCFFSSMNWNRGLFHFICPKTTMRRGMIKEQDEHMFFLLFNTNFIWMAASYQIPHGLWNIIHLSPFIATRALSTFLYSLHILYKKDILVSWFIISFYLFSIRAIGTAHIPYSSHIHIFHCSSYFPIRAPSTCLYSL